MKNFDQYPQFEFDRYDTEEFKKEVMISVVRNTFVALRRELTPDSQLYVSEFIEQELDNMIDDATGELTEA